MGERKKLTAKEIAALAKYDKGAHSPFAAARSNFLRTIGRAGINELKAIYKRVTGEEFREYASACSSCELKLQRIVCLWYDQDKVKR